MEQGNLDNITGANNRSLPNATASLVLGIVSIVTCFCYGIPGLVTGIIGLVLGAKDKKLYMENPGLYSQASYNNSKAGKICSLIGVILSSLWLLYILFILIMVGTSAMSNPWKFNRY